MAGNRAVLSALGQTRLQRKGREPDRADRFEQEATAVERAFLNGTPNRSETSDGAAESVQRSCAECELEETEEENVRRAARDEPATATPPEPPDGSGSGQADQAPTARLLADDGEPHVGAERMHKSRFLALLHSSVCDVVDEGSAPLGASSEGCPWIQEWFAYYTEQSAAHLERAILKYAPAAREAASAREYIDAVTSRVQAGVRHWASTGEINGVPEGLPLGMPAEGGAPDLQVQFKAREGVSASMNDSPAAIRARLGSGRPLDSSVRSRMESSFGTGFGNVRIHTDERATRLSRDLNARALTVGEDVAFDAGEYQPGNPIGDALVAHELAHVVQQRGAEAAPAQTKSRAVDDGHELDADRSAAAALVGLWGRGRELASELRTEAAPRMRSGLRVQRCGSCRSTPARLHDFREGTELPDAAELSAIRQELFPRSTSSSGVPLTWDGASVSGVVSPAAAAARTDLKADLMQAMLDHLNAALPDVNATASLRRLSMTELEGAGRAAKSVADARYGDWLTAAALTPTQRAVQHNFEFRGSDPNQTLFDAYDPAQRAAVNLDIDAEDLASWIANTDDAAVAEQASHNFNPDRGGEEETFFWDEVVTPFATAHQTDLETYDTFGFALTGDGVVVTPSSVEAGLSDTASGGVPSPAERAAKWSAWKILVHEYFHVVTHPAFRRAAGSNRNLKEGFTEMFTKETLQAELPRARSNTALRTEIEGGDYGKPPASVVGGYSPGSYADYLSHAEAVRDSAIGGVGGQNAVEAAYFQGHVEFLGLNPDGTPASARSGPAHEAAVPAGLTTLAELATASGLSESEILAANSGMAAGDPLPARIILPGAREHTVVESRGPADPSGEIESRAQIAAQNGVTEAALTQANPRVDWTALTTGQRILIPKH